MVYKKIHYSFHGAFIIPWKTHDATFMVINGEIQHFHELIMGISWEICLVVLATFLFGKGFPCDNYDNS